jgi:hypothetical protein
VTVNLTQLAKELRRDPSSIRELVERGLMTRLPDGSFDLETARREHRENIQHEKNVRPRLDEPEIKATDYAKNRAASQHFEAQLKKLRYEEKAKTLTPTRDIEAAQFQEMRVIRDACMNLPARISAQLATETSEHVVHQLIESEIRQIFEDYSEGRLG